MIPQVVYPDKQLSQNTKKLYKFFMQGCGAKKAVRASDILSGKVELADTVFVRGVLKGTGKIINQANNFWYMDHPYIGRYQGFNRICYNSYICGLPEADYPSDRFDELKTKLSDWRTSGDHIILCPPSLRVQKQCGIYTGSNDGWARNVIETIAQYTDRPIFVSTKYGDGLTNFKKEKPKHRFVDLIKNAWVTVAFNSNTVIDSLVHGVPVISLSPERVIGSLRDIENPIMDRSILNYIAYNQWNCKQIASGQAWAELTTRYNIC